MTKKARKTLDTLPTLFALSARDGDTCRYCGKALYSPQLVSDMQRFTGATHCGESWCTPERHPSCYYIDPATIDKTKIPTIDHVIPQSKGGTHDLSNLVLACRSCNSRKGARMTEGLNDERSF
ncbi:MAG TPA: HNH endonuclease [Herpetosiphonaceae bacterium]